MALVLPHSIFLHVPKTGGKWVAKVLQAQKWPIVQYKSTHRSHSPEGKSSIHCTLDERFPKGRKVFCFCRHPLSWYRSYWIWKQYVEKSKPNWNRFSSLDRCRSSFPQFVEKAIDRFPDGYLSTKHFEWYFDVADVVRKFERLRESLTEILTTLEPDFDPALVDNFVVNQGAGGAKYSGKFLYSQKLAERVLSWESRYIKRFKYDYITKAWVC